MENKLLIRKGKWHHLEDKVGVRAVPAEMAKVCEAAYARVITAFPFHINDQLKM